MRLNICNMWLDIYLKDDWMHISETENMNVYTLTEYK